MDHATPDATPGHPHREALRMMIAAFAILRHRGAAEFAAPHDESGVEQPAGFQVVEQRGDGAVGLGAVEIVVFLEVVVSIPGSRPFIAPAVELHKAHAALDESAREQAVAAEVGGDFVVEPVAAAHRLCLAAQIGAFRGAHLHPEGEFVGMDPRSQAALGGLSGSVVGIPLFQEIEPRPLTIGGDMARG